VRFTFLGTGTSSGVPAIACACPVCTSSDPRDNRLRCSAAVEWTDASGQGRCVLLDAGPDLRQQALRAGLTRCDAVLFTHNHVDHIFGLDEVRRFNVVQRGPVAVYAEEPTMASLRRVYTHIFEADRNVNDSFVALLEPHTIEPGRPIDLFGVRFTPVRLLHGRLPIVGFRVEPAPAAPGRAPVMPGPLPLAYCTDVNAVPAESWQHLRGLRTLVIDALRKRRHPTHFTIDEALKVVHETAPAAAYFTHITHDLAHAETDAELPEGVHLAYDGLVLEG
jgi:phosphoribosyl 1,2-cyclic phosphate phosphodiesterase